MSFVFSNSMVCGSGGITPGPGGGATAADISVNTAGLGIITSNNAQGAFEQLDAAQVAANNNIDALKDAQEKLAAAITSLQTAGSILQTTEALSENIGGTAIVALDKLTAPKIADRTFPKEPGAIVYGPDGIIGVITAVTEADATIITISSMNALLVKEWE